MAGTPNNVACPFSERTFVCGVKIKQPETAPPDRGFKVCCYHNIVLASPTSGKCEQNDYNSFYYQRQLENDTVSFCLVDEDNAETPITDSTYGDYYSFGDIEQNKDLAVIKIDWQKILLSLGEGCYKIKTKFTLVGIPYEVLSNTYTLKEFSINSADGTIRIDSIMSGNLVQQGVNFNGFEFCNSLRIKGFFGNQLPSYVQDNIVKRDFVSQQILSIQENQYTLQTEILPECITEELYCWHFLANQIFISDYNRPNHSYKYSCFPVELSNIDDVIHTIKDRGALVTASFSDRIKNKRKNNC